MENDVDFVCQLQKIVLGVGVCAGQAEIFLQYVAGDGGQTLAEIRILLAQLVKNLHVFNNNNNNNNKKNKLFPIPKHWNSCRKKAHGTQPCTT